MEMRGGCGMMMSMDECSVWWIIEGLFFSWTAEPCVSSNYPRAIPTEAGESICSLSRKLKDVSPWTVWQLAELRKTRNVYASKLLDWQLHFHGSPACELNESILEDIQAALKKVNEEIFKLPAKAIRAGALAAKSAGRLDEFITVFANAKMRKVFDTSNYCLGSGGDPAKRRDLIDCFPFGGKV
ncbi:unnamed protein product [Trypanosoma congolense IL3000]|uniref:WGS project CAEQ00000000 data, annotated contig 469 n=1 Tax=Trypanosoma congolense (strain IL3000) TaxID=1068625 RepID=F9WG61_TRYCI|nr:unnamed protein product [Trypanosoma congolense IL3000]